MSTANELADRYFALAPSPDTAAYFGQFTPDAVVEDEGNLYRGIEEIRAWRASVPPVTYARLGSHTDDDEHVAVARIAGDFPGSPVELTFRFTFTDDGRIRALAIRE